MNVCQKFYPTHYLMKVLIIDLMKEPDRLYSQYGRDHYVSISGVHTKQALHSSTRQQVVTVNVSLSLKDSFFLFCFCLQLDKTQRAIISL